MLGIRKGLYLAFEMDFDEILKYAVKNLDHIEIKTYEVDFKLSHFGKTHHRVY